MTEPIHGWLSTVKPVSGHESAWYGNFMFTVLEYNPANDGPECEVITRILASHPRYVPGVEKRALRLSLLTSQLERGK